MQSILMNPWMTIQDVGASFITYERRKIICFEAGAGGAASSAPRSATPLLGWKTKRTLDEAIASAWKWELKIRGV